MPRLLSAPGNFRASLSTMWLKASKKPEGVPISMQADNKNGKRRLP
jgi:hypothetical protein